MKNKEKKHVLWSAKQDYSEWIKELRDEYPEKTEEELLELAGELNNDYLFDLRTELNINLSRKILLIADLGLWNGRRSGYQEIGSNVKDCFYSNNDLPEWYIDKDGDLRCIDTHHDGTNYYIYRVYKENATDEQIDNLKCKIYDNTYTWDDVKKITCRLGDVIGEVYGWKFPGRKPTIKKSAQKV
jgi:hypothetical protein